MFTLEYGVKGAATISSRQYDDMNSALLAGQRWSRSNSTGHYWAEVTTENLDGTTRVVKNWNLS